MSGRREDLIAELASTAAPVRPVGRLTGPVLVWLMVTSLLALGAMLLTGPFRSGAFQQLLVDPRRLCETLLGTGAVIALAVAAFNSAIPGRLSRVRQHGLPIFLLLVWIGAYLLAWMEPGAVHSMAGKRAHCWLEALLYGLPGLLLGCLALRRLFPLHGARSGLLFGLAAGAVPAVLMQLACMWEPGHILVFHILPGLLLGAVGAGLGAFLLHRR